jgi:hypothetical protein
MKYKMHGRGDVGGGGCGRRGKRDILIDHSGGQIIELCRNVAERVEIEEIFAVLQKEITVSLFRGTRSAQ